MNDNKVLTRPLTKKDRDEDERNDLKVTSALNIIVLDGLIFN